jgi:hypothetical protein
VSKT